MKRFILAATASVFAISSAPAFAQAAADEAVDSGDIIVTATRENTLLSKTPIAITAITGEGLRDAGITDARSLNEFVPNLAISENGDSARISIRGVTSTDLTEKGDPSAAFLLDGVYIARPIEVLNSFYDLERVEVLRGPQGTLYGRNTTAGVINLISARPVGEFKASAEGGYGNLGSYKGTAMINVPIGGEIGVRAAVNFDRQDSPINQAASAPGAFRQSLNPFRNTISGRLSVGGKLGDNFDFVIRGDYTKSKGGIFNTVASANFFSSPLVSTVDPVYIDRGARAQRFLSLPLNSPDRKNNEFKGIMGEFTYDFGSVALTYLGSYRESKRKDVRILQLNPNTTGGGSNNPAFFFGDFKQNSHELRLAFGQGQRLHGQVGGYYFNEKSFIELNIGQPISALVPSGFMGFDPEVIGFAFPQGPTKAISKAGFGQLTFDVTSDLHITGGIRYTKDNKSRVGATVIDFSSIAGRNAVALRRPGSFSLANCAGVRCTLNSNIAFGNYKKTTWKIGVDYDAPNLGLIYASASSGYKAGGFNDGCLSTSGGLGCTLTRDQLLFNPETLTSYEAGFKFRFADNALRISGSIFHYDYSNLQLSQIVTVPVPATRIRNAGVAKVDGIELEAVIQPSENDRVDLGFTYTDARYTSFIARASAPATMTAPAVTQVSFAGRQLDQAPKYTASAGYSHTFQLGNGGKVEAGVRTRLSAEYYLQDLNNLSQFRQPSFTKTGATLTYKASEDRFFVQGFVQNIENNITLAAASSGNLGSSATIEEPRTYGIRAGFKF
jgi:iron complex outermembrane recepter protein